MSRRFFAIVGVAVLCTSASFAKSVTLEVRDRFGDPVVDAEIVAIVDGVRIQLGKSSRGLFDIDVEPGSTIEVLSVAEGRFVETDVEIPEDVGSTVVARMPALRQGESRWGSLGSALDDPFGPPRPPEGACCLEEPLGDDDDDATCVVTNGDTCSAIGGEYIGDGTECVNPTGEECDHVDEPGVAIPDPGYVTDTIEVTEDFVIADLDVDFATDHTFVGDLLISLRSPSGTVVPITAHGLEICASEDGIDAIFDDEAGDFTCGASPISGTFKPKAGFLSDFDGELAAGTWEIKVEDQYPGESGSLLRWSLHFDKGTSPCDGACCTDAPGVASDCIETSRDECERDDGLFVGGSCDAIDDCLPLYVEFESLSATQVRGGVAVRWVTTIEMETAGFRVLRESGGRTKSLDGVGSFVPANGNGLTGASYEVLDRTPGDAIRYWLEEVDIRGKVTRHGPILVERPSRRSSRQAR